MSISIHPIQMGLDTVYIIKGESVILIDGGDPHKLNVFQEGLEKASINPKDIQLIILTHGHWDHIGSAKDIKDLTGAKVLMHQKDMKFLDETYPSQPPGITPWGKVIIALLKLYSPLIRIPSFDVDIIVDDEGISLTEYGIPGKVIHTPGHTWGSLSVLMDSGEIFVGDLAMNKFPMRLTPGLPIFGDDIQVVKESWRRVLEMGAKTVFPAHGKSFPVDVMREAVMISS
ncbi:MAG: MBL fold metallo-hydrolase [Anaerolineales bacterium]|uniref:MBL fold metallo-hydrolase n=1 Tax=Candidatus Desulfolinea nitratireducens TaxID=2841698 RepID=A0A8J6NPE0_9CHLR|nr:MBL fold metallo-hydrolase [Candidatus Desulfolinea nitratireducens]MBL6961497.1 MBL fold metallo-hydrolase [Anaerolineales bacterium]